jgi:hypothetical protein
MDMCGVEIAARCVRFGDRDIPEWSGLKSDASLKDALDELYRETDDAAVRTQLAAGGGCVTLSATEVSVSFRNIMNAACALLSDPGRLREGFGRVGRCAGNG